MEDSAGCIQKERVDRAHQPTCRQAGRVRDDQTVGDAQRASGVQYRPVRPKDTGSELGSSRACKYEGACGVRSEVDIARSGNVIRNDRRVYLSQDERVGALVVPEGYRLELQQRRAADGIENAFASTRRDRVALDVGLADLEDP